MKEMPTGLPRAKNAVMDAFQPSEIRRSFDELHM